MKYKILLLILLILLIPLAVTAAIALASGLVQGGEQNQASLLPSQPFTYQGELLDDGQPESGPCDFQFGLWDATTLGSQVGITQTLNSVQLDNGRFTVLLNDDGQIGANPFDGQTLWLAIEVDCPSGTGSYVSLTPRQQLTAAPYAHFSTETGFVPWNGITSKPDGFADDIDDDTLYDAGTGLDLITTTFEVDDSYQLPQGCATDYLVEWNGSAWGCLEPTEPGYANVIVVAKSGGDFDSIQGALGSITDAVSENRYLVWVAPGVYSETVAMISWVDIEGAGVDLTRIESEGFTSSTSATLVAAENSELRSLTIENTGGANLAYGIFSDSDGFSVRNVKVIASGGTLFNRGIVIRGGPLNSYIQGCSVVVDSQIASAPSDGINVLANSGDIKLHLHDVAIMAESTIDEAITGIRQEAGTDYTNIITATGLSINANNTNSSWGFAIISQRVGSILNLFNSSVSGIGQPGAGIYMLAGATVNISNAIIQGEECGIWLQTSSTSGIAEVDNSIVVGGVYSILTSGESGHHVNIGSSLLDGDTLIASGNTITCVNSYDESYTNVNGFDSCP